MARVLVVEDDAQLARALRINLEVRSYEVAAARDGDGALRLFATGEPDAVLLDLGLPDTDGVELIKAIRSRSRAPILVLSARHLSGEKVRALDAGADDYVTKPFGTQELMARVRALLRTRSVPADGTPPVFDDGHLRVDLVRREVALQGEPVALTRKEYALLSLLLRNAGRVVTQPQILQEIWGPTHQHDTHYLRILVGKLRHKLGDSALDSRYLFTEPGVGLRFKG